MKLDGEGDGDEALRKAQRGFPQAKLSRAYSPKWNPRQRPLLLVNIKGNWN
jgi:hypothetical protein